MNMKISKELEEENKRYAAMLQEIYDSFDDFPALVALIAARRKEHEEKGEDLIASYMLSVEVMDALFKICCENNRFDFEELGDNGVNVLGDFEDFLGDKHGLGLCYTSYHEYALYDPETRPEDHDW